MTMLLSDFRVYSTAEELKKRSGRNHYFALRLLSHDVPMRSEESVLYYKLLLSNIFELTATSLVFGDTNTPLNAAIDASSETIRHEPSRLASSEYISQSGVIDTW